MTHLTECDKEQIQIPGAILPHGAMLVVDRETLVVLQAAGDTSALLGQSINALLGQSVEQLFTPEQMLRLRGLCSDSEPSRPRHLLDPMLRALANVPLDASAHRSDDVLVLEFEKAELSDRFADDPLAAVQLMVDGFGLASSLSKLCQLATDSVRKIAPYDRVMVYRFMEDGSGWVIGESRAPGLAPFLDLHYPAADIPKQARALYLKNWLRLITQVDYDPAPLTPALNPKTGKPLDMSHAVLRDVSPVHREYLRNMGVDASMSISIIVEGKLWGLIACHHSRPRHLPRHLRAVCELFGAMFSLQIEAREKSEQFESRLASRKVLHLIMLNLAKVDDYAFGLTQQSPNLLDYIHGADAALYGRRHGGVAICVDGAITLLGVTPNRQQIVELTKWLTSQMSEGDGVFSTDRLGELWGPAKEFAVDASGLLAISVPRDPSDFILWFRPELVETASWAGLPEKSVTKGSDGERLSPRKSFEVWKQEVRGRAMLWTPAELDAAFDLRVSLMQIVLRRIEAATRERAKAYDRDQLLMLELDHRVKNTLANIQALVVHSSRSADSLASFVKGLDERLHAMAKGHSLLTQSRWEGVSIRDLLLEELEPYRQAGISVELRGAEVVLTSKSALALSLALHELATNAAKFGAFSTTAGRVAVDWHLSGKSGVVLRWQESGGPPVEPPKRRGFGSSLIERALALETGGIAKIRYERTGVVCEVTLPTASLVATASRQPPASSPEPAVLAVADNPIARRPRIFFVEDSSLLIIELEAMCEDMGWEIVGPATRLGDALVLARTGDFDAAFLDVNLNGEMSWDAATVLKERGIQFAFSTGYDGANVLPSHLVGARVLRKPYRISDIEGCIRQMIGHTK